MKTEKCSGDLLLRKRKNAVAIYYYEDRKIWRRSIITKTEKSGGDLLLRRQKNLAAIYYYENGKIRRQSIIVKTDENSYNEHTGGR